MKNEEVLMQKRYYSYKEFVADTRELITLQKDFQAESIVAIARGGLTLGHAMAEGLNLREVQTIRTELYDASCKRENISLFGSCSFDAVKRVLVVDDIADSGETLKKVMEYLESNFPQIEFKVATLFYKPVSLYKPHFWVNEAKEWIEFFWEKDFS